MLGKKTIVSTMMAIVVWLMIAGCGAINKNGHAVLVGAVYSHVTFPLTADLNQTPAGIDTGGGKVIRIKEPFSGYGIYAEFNSNAIGEIAKNHGLKKVYHADIERLSILGIWRHDKVVIYGAK